MKQIFDKFQHEGTYLTHERYGSGHINDTYLITCTHPDRQYVLQWVNHRVFHHIPEVMMNIERVTEHIKQQYMMEGIDPKDKVLSFIPTIDGMSYYLDGEDHYRLFHFVENSVSFEQVPHPSYLELAGEAFGEFQKRLHTFDPSELFETIRDFHHTPKRFAVFKESLKQAIPERVVQAKEWIDFVLSKEEYANLITKGIEEQTIPLRVTHNDTKINNILFDKTTEAIKCIVDLDTVMPGSLLYDYGDAIRFGCSTALEDEVNLSLIDLDLERFETFTKGFIRPLKDVMTKTEFDYLPVSAIIITLELGMRFLMDHLLGDVYFKIHRENHNFDRAKSQLTLVKRMEEKMIMMTQIVDKYR